MMALALMPLLALLLASAFVPPAPAVKEPVSSRTRAVGPGVWLEPDLSYGPHGPLNTLDVYRPDTNDKLPLVVFIHGGGWSEGDKGTHTRKGRFFAEQGFVYATINYRLSPRIVHPAHVEDVARAVAWLEGNAARFGIDAERIFLVGHSAGAHLAALVASQPRYLRAFGTSPSIIDGVVLLDGSGYHLPTRIPKARGWSRKMYLQAFGTDPEVWKDASPALQLHPSLQLESVIRASSRMPLRSPAQSDRSMTTAAALALANDSRTRAPGPEFLIFHVVGRAPSEKQARILAAAVRLSGGRADVVRVTGRNHVTINRKIGNRGDPVTARILRFLRQRPGAIAEGPAVPALDVQPASHGRDPHAP